jgi:hypothetical protein
MVHEEMINVHNCCACKSHPKCSDGNSCVLYSLINQRDGMIPKLLPLAPDQKEAPSECPAKLGVLFIDEDCMR